MGLIKRYNGLLFSATRILSLITLVFLLSQSYAKAEEVSGDIQDMIALFSEEKMVITPSKYLQPMSHSPSTITIITSEDIRNSGATTIPDILRMVPGMEVMQTSSPEFNVSTRGDSQLLANKLLVLIDGHPFQEEVENTVIWSAIPISLEEIERIEVIRGPGSAMWGANAFDGLVNIITRSPGSMKGTLISATGGGWGTGIGNLIHDGGSGRINYRLSIGYSRADTLPGRDEVKLKVKVRDQGLDVSRGNGVVEYQISQNRSISLSGGISSLPVYDGPRLNNGWGDTDIKYNYYQVKYEGPNALFRAYWSKYDIMIHGVDVNWKRDPATYDLSPNSELYNLEWNYKRRFGTTHQLISGINYRQLISVINFRSIDTGGNFITGGGTLHMTGLFLQDEWHPLETLTLIYGGRYDTYTTIDNTLSPRAAIIYQPYLHHTFRLSTGVAYRSPTPLELFEPGGGNLDLRHEKVTTYEAGYSTLLFQRLKGDINLFYNRLTDLIPVEEESNVNLYSIDVYGGEIGGEFLYNKWLTTFLNLSQQKIHRHDVARVERNSPEYKVNGGVRLHFTEGLSANLMIHYVSRVEYGDRPYRIFRLPNNNADPYTLVNLQIMYSLWKDKMSLALSAFNVFNDAHKEHPLGDIIGQRILAQVTYRM